MPKKSLFKKESKKCVITGRICPEAIHPRHRVISMLHDTPQANATDPSGPPCLFAFPAEDNFHGAIYPLDLIKHVRQALGPRWHVLLDAACFAATSAIDLSKYTPDYVALSFYKMAGYPSLGALLVRRPTDNATEGPGYCLRRPYFAGGSVVECTSTIPWQMYKEFPARLEDGTLPFLSIVALKGGLTRLSSLTMSQVPLCGHMAMEGKGGRFFRRDWSTTCFLQFSTPACEIFSLNNSKMDFLLIL